MKSLAEWFRLSSLLGDNKLVESIAVKVRRRLAEVSSHPDAIQFGGETLAPGDEKLHFAYLGTTGSGKSTLIQLLMQQALASLGQGHGRRALIYDAKRDLLSHLARVCPQVPCYLLNPFDQRGVAWQLSDDVTDPTSAFQIASIFIPANDKLAQPFFEDTSRAVIKAVMVSLMSLTRLYKTKWDLRDVILGCSPRHVMRVLEISDQNKDTIDSLLRGREDTAKDVFATLSTKLDPFRPIAALWANAKESISLRQWTCSEAVLVLGSNPAKSEAINTINRIIFSRVADLLSDFPDARNHRADPRRSWIFLDELAQLHRLPKLREMFAFGRSKGVCVCVGFQDIEGLYAIHGKDTTHSLLANIGHKAILRLESDVTASWASSMFGKKQMFIETSSVSENHSANGAGGSTGVSQGFHELPEVLASEFMGVTPAGKAGIGGYYLYPGAMKWHWATPFDGSLVEPDFHTSNFEPASSEAEYLRDWDQKDFERLHLSGSTSLADSPKRLENKRKGRLPSAS